MSLHRKAIEWLVKQLPDAFDNHYSTYTSRVMFDGLRPDVIADDQIHEVEIVSDKAAYKRIQNDKTLWIIIPSFEVFNQINLVGYINDIFTPLGTASDVIEKEKLKNEIIALKTERNRLIRTTKLLKKQHKIKTDKAKRVFYLLPSFQFEKEFDPDKCAICSNESAVVIANEGTPPYGLCKPHFDALIEIEGE